jgi:hypothetical protein
LLLLHKIALKKCFIFYLKIIVENLLRHRMEDSGERYISERREEDKNPSVPFPPEMVSREQPPVPG